MSSSNKWRAASKRLGQGLLRFFKANWIGGAVILAATLLYFWPLIMNIGTYSPGGDAMFNAWTIARNQNCILQQGCPDYSNANIFYPNQDTMLYSETQLSSAFITLPFHWLTDNPILAYNVLTVASFFLAGWFMYMLVKYLSRGHEVVAILAGLIFAFAPFKIASLYHLQNLSIFCLPLAVLFTLKFFDTQKQVPIKPNFKLNNFWRNWPQRFKTWIISAVKSSATGKWYLVGLLLALLYIFFASWVQMVFVLMIMALLLAGMWLFRLATTKSVILVGLVVTLAVATTMPLALQYIEFSKNTGATFGAKAQLLYSSSLSDYIIPHTDTLLGALYYAPGDKFPINSYNQDSYSYMGIAVYLTVAILAILAFALRKRSAESNRSFKFMAVFLIIGLVGFVVSLGPLLKIKGNYVYDVFGGINVVLPLPWAVVSKFLPQLDFIRAIGRAALLPLFALCCALAFLPYYVRQLKLRRGVYVMILILLCGAVLFELMPAKQITMATTSYSYNLTVPEVYKFIKSHPEINNFITLVTDYDYPGAPIPIARAEQVLWSGYHNRNIFDGYSGYEPKDYIRDHEDYNDFYADDIPKLKSRGLEYVLVDKELCKNHPDMPGRVDAILGSGRVYSDSRYSLYKLP